MIFYLLQTFTAFESYFSWMMHLHKHLCATFVIFCSFCCLTSLNQHVLKDKYAFLADFSVLVSIKSLVPIAVDRPGAVANPLRSPLVTQ